ncbi:MAG: hypothetical protein K0V04_28950 [Deltaproteobacteria bacterium]|nr:hypothetical protein [Deltaproteobacteria bacterium]
MSPHAYRIATAVVSGLLTTGCSEVTFPAIQYETQRARIGTTFDFELCAGDLELVDRQVGAIEERLGVERASRISLYLYELGQLPCENSPFGCYFREQDAVATLPFAIDHELVHAVARGQSFENRFWSEGIAEAVKGEGTFNPYTPALATYAQSDSARLDYATAGHFVRWLVETRGLASLQRIVAGEPQAEVLGASIEQLAAEYDAAAPFAFPDWSPCAHPPLPATGDGVWEERLEFDCQSTDAHRLRGGPGPTVSRSIEVPAGTYRLSMEDGDAVYLLGCQTETLPEYRPSFNDDETVQRWNGSVFNEVQLSRTAPAMRFESEVDHQVELTQGTYELMVSALDDDGSYAGTVRLQRVP